MTRERDAPSLHPGSLRVAGDPLVGPSFPKPRAPFRPRRQTTTTAAAGGGGDDDLELAQCRKWTRAAAGVGAQDSSQARGPLIRPSPATVSVTKIVSLISSSSFVQADHWAQSLQDDRLNHWLAPILIGMQLQPGPRSGERK